MMVVIVDHELLLGRLVSSDWARGELMGRRRDYDQVR